MVAEHAFESLTSPVIRVTTPDMQIPFSPALEKQMYPNRNTIADAIRKVLGVPEPLREEQLAPR
jgi:pyruvate dehydrogenase E1 component beta subunit